MKSIFLGMWKFHFKYSCILREFGSWELTHRREGAPVSQQKYFSAVGMTQESECIGTGALLPGQEQVHIFPDTPEVEK